MPDNLTPPDVRRLIDASIRRFGLSISKRLNEAITQEPSPVAKIALWRAFLAIEASLPPEPVEPTEDPELDAHLESLARDCRCCPDCGSPPCGGCQQGAPCDASACRCDNGDDDELFQPLEFADEPIEGGNVDGH